MGIFSFLMRVFFPSTNKPKPQPQISFTDLQYVWNYQMIVIPNTTVLDLLEPLIDINLNLKNSLSKHSHLFPFIVGDNGNLISPNYGRRVNYGDQSQRTSMYLEYPLDTDKKTKVILRIMGKDPQSIHIVHDERRAPSNPMILFMYKPRRLPQEKC